MLQKFSSPSQPWVELTPDELREHMQDVLASLKPVQLPGLSSLHRARFIDYLESYIIGRQDLKTRATRCIWHSKFCKLYRHFPHQRRSDVEEWNSLSERDKNRFLDSFCKSLRVINEHAAKPIEILAEICALPKAPYARHLILGEVLEVSEEKKKSPIKRYTFEKNPGRNQEILSGPAKISIDLAGDCECTITWEKCKPDQAP